MQKVFKCYTIIIIPVRMETRISMEPDLETLRRKLNQFTQELEHFTPEPKTVGELKVKIKSLSGLLEMVNRKVAS